MLDGTLRSKIRWRSFECGFREWWPFRINEKPYFTAKEPGHESKTCLHLQNEVHAGNMTMIACLDAQTGGKNMNSGERTMCSTSVKLILMYIILGMRPHLQCGTFRFKLVINLAWKGGCTCKDCLCSGSKVKTTPSRFSRGVSRSRPSL